MTKSDIDSLLRTQACIKVSVTLGRVILGNLSINSRQPEPVHHHPRNLPWTISVSSYGIQPQLIITCWVPATGDKSKRTLKQISENGLKCIVLFYIVEKEKRIKTAVNFGFQMKRCEPY